MNALGTKCVHGVCSQNAPLVEHTHHSRGCAGLPMVLKLHRMSCSSALLATRTTTLCCKIRLLVRCSEAGLNPAVHVPNAKLCSALA